MYIIKVKLTPRDYSVPDAIAVQILDHELEPSGTWSLVPTDFENQIARILGYSVNYKTFGYEAAKTIAANVLCSVGHNLRYAYTDGFLPDATFVFEYDR